MKSTMFHFGLCDNNLYCLQQYERLGLVIFSFYDIDLGQLPGKFPPSITEKEKLSLSYSARIF